MQQVEKHSGLTFAVSHPRDVVLSQSISASLQLLEISLSWYIQCKWVTLLHLSVELIRFVMRFMSNTFTPAPSLTGFACVRNYVKTVVKLPLHWWIHLLWKTELGSNCSSCCCGQWTWCYLRLWFFLAQSGHWKDFSVLCVLCWMTEYFPNFGVQTIDMKKMKPN